MTDAELEALVRAVNDAPELDPAEIGLYDPANSRHCTDELRIKDEIAGEDWAGWDSNPEPID